MKSDLRLLPLRRPPPPEKTKKRERKKRTSASASSRCGTPPRPWATSSGPPRGRKTGAEARAARAPPRRPPLLRFRPRARSLARPPSRCSGATTTPTTSSPAGGRCGPTPPTASSGTHSRGSRERRASRGTCRTWGPASRRRGRTCSPGRRRRREGREMEKKGGSGRRGGSAGSWASCRGDRGWRPRARRRTCSTR